MQNRLPILIGTISFAQTISRTAQNAHPKYFAESLMDNNLGVTDDTGVSTGITGTAFREAIARAPKIYGHIYPLEFQSVECCRLPLRQLSALLT